ncbi:F-box/kelch-repeat protein At3g06240-like [Camellia sinensis]|uniref:F-box/kelch-repeat protein At3g06240-like n=1 Tax=Camellia sinensis TaxID=4442 RepID=UPI001036B8D8|nr:F-box/kelch-repeat protein At3g06240-like [Camellia sinensis]
MVSVYTLRTNLWGRIEDSPYDHTVHGPPRGILVRGALHWLARKGVGSNKSTVIVSFDLADENFRDMPSPDSVDNFILVEELGVLGGCLCVLVPGYGVYNDVWVMKEYDMRDSWIKFTINCNNFCKPLCLSTTGEVLLEVSQRKLVLFNPQERKSKELVVQGSPYLFEAGTYMESLVSPNFSNINDHEGSRLVLDR